MNLHNEVHANRDDIQTVIDQIPRDRFEKKHPPTDRHKIRVLCDQALSQIGEYLNKCISKNLPISKSQLLNYKATIEALDKLRNSDLTLAALKKFTESTPEVSALASSTKYKNNTVLALSTAFFGVGVAMAIVSGANHPVVFAIGILLALLGSLCATNAISRVADPSWSARSTISSVYSDASALAWGLECIASIDSEGPSPANPSINQQ